MTYETEKLSVSDSSFYVIPRVFQIRGPKR